MTRRSALDSLLTRARSQIERVRPRAASAAIDAGAMLVDIRPEFQRRADGEVPGAIVIERNHLEWRLHPSSAGRIAEACDLDTRWIVICDEGYSSLLAAASLRAIGLGAATDVVGGFRAWRAARLPVVKRRTPTAARMAPPARMRRRRQPRGSA